MEISIVTPSYKQFDYLWRCVMSVNDQTVIGGLEHIVQDGGGGDEFQEFVSEISTVDSVSCFYEQDHGMYDAINRGFQRSKGDVIAWLNCDEQYLPGALEKVGEWFEQNPDKDVLFGDIVMVNEMGEPVSYRKALKPWKNHIRYCFLPTYSAATFIRRSVLDGNFFLDPDYRAISDAVWILTLLENDVECGVLNEPLAAFTQYGGNMGQQAAGLEEARRWRVEIGASSSFGKILWGFLHRVRKLLRGDYLYREVSISIYTANTDKRVCTSNRVNGVWSRT